MLKKRWRDHGDIPVIEEFFLRRGVFWKKNGHGLDGKLRPFVLLEASSLIWY